MWIEGGEVFKQFCLFPHEERLLPSSASKTQPQPPPRLSILLCLSPWALCLIWPLRLFSHAQSWPIIICLPTAADRGPDTRRICLPLHLPLYTHTHTHPTHAHKHMHAHGSRSRTRSNVRTHSPTYSQPHAHSNERAAQLSTTTTFTWPPALCRI